MARSPSAPAIPAGYQRLEGSEQRPAGGACPRGAGEYPRGALRDHGRAAPSMPDLDSFTRTVPRQRPRLTADEFAASYGATPADLDRVVAFAHAHGLTVVVTHAARTVVASGTVAQMSAAFAVSLARFQHTVASRRRGRPTSQTCRGLDGFTHVPRELGGIILGVFGLDNRSLLKHNSAGPPEHHASQRAARGSAPPVPRQFGGRSEDRHRLRDGLRSQGYSAVLCRTARGASDAHGELPDGRILATRALSDIEYTFKHALTHEVAYGGLLHDRQRALHARITEAIDRLSPSVSPSRSSGWPITPCAGRCGRRRSPIFARRGSGPSRGRPTARPSLLEQALGALRRLPETRETMIELTIDLRIDLRNALVPLGDRPRVEIGDRSVNRSS